MRRLFLSFAVLALSLVGVTIVPQHSVAAPLPAPYSAAAGGDLAAFDLNVTNGPNLVGARLAVSQSTMDGGNTPTAEASVSNVVAGATGLGIVAQSATQTAPPDNPNADTGTLGGGSAPGLLSLGLLDTSVQARSQAAIACIPGGGVMANSQVKSTGAILNPPSAGIVANTGNSSTSGVVAIFPEPASHPLNRAIFSTATGNITSNAFLNGQVQVAIAGQSTLQARATGEPGGASVTYTPGTVTVNTVSNPSTTVVDLGESATFNVPGGRVIITVNQPTITASPNGRTANVAVVTAQIISGPLGSPFATAKVDLLPLRASAVAPPGGIDCPPAPVLITPADGSTITDTTPTFTGTAVPGAEVDIFVDGDPIGTTTANGAGNFSFTPGTPLPIGNHTARARQITAGGIAKLSLANDFSIDTEAPAAPTLVRPSDGSVTRDRTPTFRGRAEPGSEVEIFVDGTSIGTTTTNGNGDFSFTPTTPLAAGPHEAFVRATDAAGNDSPPSNTNGFRIDTDAPAAPVITSPEDGSTTTDSTFPIRGTAEPGSQVIIIRDGEEIGSTMADGNGDFTFNLPSGLLPVGRYGFSARAVDEAGNSSPAAEPVYVEVLGTQAAAVDDGPGQSLADTGGPQGWVSLVAVLGVLAGAGVLAVARWRRRSSHVEL